MDTDKRILEEQSNELHRRMLEGAFQRMRQAEAREEGYKDRAEGAERLVFALRDCLREIADHPEAGTYYLTDEGVFTCHHCTATAATSAKFPHIDWCPIVLARDLLATLETT